MKIRTIYLIVMLLCIACVMISSIGVQPDATMLHLHGYSIGINFTHNVWIKIIGFVCLCLFIINYKKSNNAKI